tara:strand:- start:894 stop:2558 length:1665 start_codon:yes stop_codon:yes gene_type:complete
MDISGINNQQDVNATDSVEEDFDIDLEKEESGEEIEKNKKNKLTKLKAKRHQVHSRSLANEFESDDIQAILNKKNSNTEKNELEKVKDRVKKGFNKELSNFIKETNHQKTMSLLQKNPDHDPLLNSEESSEKSKKKTKELTSAKARQEYILKQPELNTPLKNYIALFGENQLKKSKETVAKLNTLRNSLKTNGVSQHQLVGIEKSVQAHINKDLKRLLKQKFMDLAFASEKKQTSELLDNYSKYQTLLTAAKEANVFNADMQGLNQLKADTKYDVSNFLAGELDRTIVETKLNTTANSELIKAFDTFNSISEFSKFDIGNYLKTFHKKIDNEGLTPFISPDKPGYLDTDTHNQSNQQNKQNHEQIEETESLEDELLNLEIKSHLSHKLFDTIKTRLNLMSLKQTCKKKKIDIHAIQKKAHAIATLRAKMECRSLFETRATLPKLAGPEYQKFQKNLKSILKTLKKLNNPMSAQDLRLIRDQSNKAIFSIIKEDYIKTNLFLETNSNNTTLLNQKKHFLSILKRIQSETPINESLAPKLLEELQFLEDVNINEAA